MARERASADGRVGGAPSAASTAANAPYDLDAQVGFRLRQASQRHHAIFGRTMPADLTPRQWAVLAKLREGGPSPQNLLGRRTAMDAATIKGVVDRLAARGLLQIGADAADGRRRQIALTTAGATLVRNAVGAAHATTIETLSPLTAGEKEQLLMLLAKIS